MSEGKYLTGMPLFLAAVALALATFLIVLDYSIANVSIPYISGDLGVAVDQGTYVITSFAVGSAIVLPLCGWLTKRIGIVRLMVFSILGFTLLSWVCGMSRNIGVLVFARFIQGLLAGPMIPLSNVDCFDVSSGKEECRTLFLEYRRHRRTHYWACAWRMALL